MTDYVKNDTEIVYSKGDCNITYTPQKGLKGTRKNNQQREFIIGEDLIFL